MTAGGEQNVNLILNKHGTVIFEATGAYIITVPEFPYPERPVLAHHDYAEDRITWARENREEHGKIITELLHDDEPPCPKCGCSESGCYEVGCLSEDWEGEASNADD